MAEPNPRLAEARLHLERVTMGLARRIGVTDTAHVLAGALVGLLMANAGRLQAIDFLEDVTDQLREDHPENFIAEPGA